MIEVTTETFVWNKIGEESFHLDCLLGTAHVFLVIERDYYNRQRQLVFYRAYVWPRDKERRDNDFETFSEARFWAEETLQSRPPNARLKELQQQVADLTKNEDASSF